MSLIIRPLLFFIIGLSYSTISDAAYNCSSALAQCQADVDSWNILYPGYTPDYCRVEQGTGKVIAHIFPEDVDLPQTYLCQIVSVPSEYACELPKEWVFTITNEWKCAQVSLIPENNVPNVTGLYGTPGTYNAGTYLNAEECDSDIPYECIIPNCEFWNPLSLINALCK